MLIHCKKMFTSINKRINEEALAQKCLNKVLVVNQCLRVLNAKNNYVSCYKQVVNAGTVAKWSRALVQNHLKWTVPSLNPGEGCYGDGELS